MKVGLNMTNVNTITKLFLGLCAVYFITHIIPWANLEAPQIAECVAGHETKLYPIPVVAIELPIPTIRVTATAYTHVAIPGVADINGTGDGITATGTYPQHGTVAVDPQVIPLGTKLYIPGYGYGTAEDTGGAIKGNRIDVFFDCRSQAFKWGIQQVDIKIITCVKGGDIIGYK